MGLTPYNFCCSLDSELSEMNTAPGCKAEEEDPTGQALTISHAEGL